MKHAYVRNNVIERIFPDEVQESVGVWMSCEDDAKVGDVFDKSLLSRDEKIALEMPCQKDIIDSLWNAIAHNDLTKLNELKGTIKEVENKNPL